MASTSRRQRILAYSLVNGYEKFDSLEQFGEQLPDRMNARNNRLRPCSGGCTNRAGNFFDILAGTLIALQLDAMMARYDKDDRKAINVDADASPLVPVDQRHAGGRGLER